MMYKLRKNAEFRMVYRRGKSFANRILVLYIYKNRNNKDNQNDLYNKVGISVSKKVGNSVVRSKCKRLISESYRLNSDVLPTGYDFVFVARGALKDKSYKEVESAVLHLFKKAGLNDEASINQTN